MATAVAVGLVAVAMISVIKSGEMAACSTKQKKENNMLPNQDAQKNTLTTMGVRRPCLKPDAANDSFYHAAINAAKTRTYRAAVSAGLSTAEREDLFQEIMLDIFERQSEFDPTRGAPGTFTGLVSAHRTAEFLNARKANRYRMTFAEGNDIDTLEVLAIDGTPDDIDLTQDAANDERAAPKRSSSIDETSPWWNGDKDLFSDSNTLHDLLMAVGYMSEEQQSLFNYLDSHLDLPAAAKSSGMSSATFYRRVADLQMHLRMFGIRTPV